MLPNSVMAAMRVEKRQFACEDEMEEEADIRVLDVAKALAFIGDLSMGQPTDHSVRTAWLAAQVATDAGYGTNQCDVVKHVSLLRWSGCTANAHGFAELIGDDVAGREAMLARRPDSAVAAVFARGEGASISGLAQIHCEVSGEIARMLALDHDTEVALRNIFENRDGSGFPNHVAGDGVPRAVSTVSLAGDLEILSRVYGLDAALTLLTKDAGSRYPAELVDLVSKRGRQWHEALEHEAGHDFDGFLTTDRTQQLTSPELIADVIDLKLPWMTQYSRRVAQACARCCASLGMAASTQRLVYRAGLIHGMGRTSVSNLVWNTSGQLSAAAWEKIRLVPYWTQRAGKNIAALQPEAAIASFAYERLDGSGYFRSASGREISLEARVLSTAVAWIALRSPRPWRAQLSFEEAVRTLTKEAQAGRFDVDAVEAMTSSEQVASVRAPDRVKRATLSEREVDVLRHISQGASNKEVARTLGISMSTVGTHVEKVFRKLECSTRAAATLKASTMGLL
jgi:response regulator RpfG family c-di-GMP phosphodiesterase/DNA-binding CsgD family transcriptional regulator